MTTKFKVALKLSSLNAQAKLTKADTVFNQMKKAPTFDPKTWPIPPASVQKAIDNLDAAITTAATGAPGSVSHMHEMERVLVSVFNLLKSYVELVANDTTDPKAAIESAGMTAAAFTGGSAVTDLTLTAKGNGVVEVSVPRGKGEAAFIYQYSSDGGATWKDFEYSKLASVELKGQTPGVNLSFRFAAISKTTNGFSQPKSVIVV
jgi:hypothetical protein